jgi:hypothetical protein
MTELYLLSDLEREIRKLDSENKAMKETMYRAIKAGDWKVDGACDPDLYLRDYNPNEEDL